MKDQSENVNDPPVVSEEKIEEIAPEEVVGKTEQDHIGLSKPKPAPPPHLSEAERAKYAKLMLRNRKANNEVQKAKTEFDRYLISLAIEKDYTGPSDLACHEMHIVPAAKAREWSNNGTPENKAAIEVELQDYPKITKKEEQEMNRKNLEFANQVNKFQKTLTDINDYLFTLAEALNYAGTFPVEIDSEGYMKPAKAQPQLQPQIRNPMG